MNKKKIFNIYLFVHIVIIITTFAAFIVGIGLATLSYEKTAFAQANVFATNNSSTNSTLIFEYKPKNAITDKNIISDYNNFLNDFSGSRKYFPIACGWTQSEATNISHDNLNMNITFSDLNYLINDNNEYASNLLELSYPETYAEAFEESAEKIYINGDELKLQSNATYVLSVRQGKDTLVNNEINWSSSNLDVAEIDSDGQITAKSNGETIIIAKSNDLYDEIKVIVSDQFVADKLEIFTPCIVPLNIARQFGNENPEEAVGQTFNASFNNVLVTFKIGGYYENNATKAPYRNALYFNNIGEQIYILRSSNYYHYPIEKVYFTLTSEYKVNMNIYNDIHYLKTISNLTFNIPKDMPINNIGYSLEDATTIYDYVVFVNETSLKVTGWIFGCLSIVLFIVDFVFLRKRMSSFIFYLSSYAFGVILVPTIFYLINPVTISNRICFIMNAGIGWTIIAIAIIYSIIITYKMIHKDNRKNEYYLVEKIEI